MENIEKLRNFMKSSFSTEEDEGEYELSDQQKKLPYFNLLTTRDNFLLSNSISSIFINSIITPIYKNSYINWCYILLYIYTIH